MVTESDYTIEQWADIPGYEGRYQISSFGNVRRLFKRGDKLPLSLLVQGNVNGYPLISLHGLPRKRKWFLVHRLVMLVFEGACPDGYEVNHKNGDKKDNRLSNLEYLTPSQNIKHSFDALGRQPVRGEQHYQSKFTEQQVLEMRELRQQGWLIREIADKYQGNFGTISHIIQRKTWKHI